MSIAFFLWLALSLAPATAASGASSGSLTVTSSTNLAKQAREAYARGDKVTFLSLYQELVSRRPGDVSILYNLACAQALNNQADAAIRTLEEILAQRVSFAIERDTDFDVIRQTNGYRRVVERMSQLRQSRISAGAVRAFTIPERGLVAEGVAYDPVTKAFFVSSVRHRKIVRVDRGGKITEFVSPARDGLRSALGMAVDARRRTLWVASQAIPSMDGYEKEQPRGAAVFEYDVDSGRLREEHAAPGEGESAPGFDDLTLAPDGTVYVNDGFHSRIWRIPPGGRLEVFLTSDAIGGTQGLAVSSDGRTLYASDYRGLFSVHVATRRLTPMRVPPDLSLNGIDGLASFGNSLVAIQNGIVPHRVIRLDLAGNRVAISRARILEINHPDFDEPTLGVVVDGALYFSADSQGQKFLDEKKPIGEAEMREAVILKLSLSRSARAR